MKSLLLVIWLAASLAVTDLLAGELPEAPLDRDYYQDGRPPVSRVRLGQNLFFDKILSGNRNISCASCHHPAAHTGDQLSVALGEGSTGLGANRKPGSPPDEAEERIARNSQPLFNLGAREFTRLFHDGRVEADPADPGRFLTPAGDELPSGVDNALAAQAMMPVVSSAEMAGQFGENAIADAVEFMDFSLAWELLAQRLRQSDSGYVDLFIAAFDDVDQAADITFVHAANAMAAFQATTWRADNSPFDQYLRGDRQALDEMARRGMVVFYGKGGCDGCHSGPFQTDHQFYSIGLPQIGPGRGNGFDGREDFGREQVTGNPAHRFKFRTPSLRNVALTGPWGHDGAYGTLRGIVLHHLDPLGRTEDYQRVQAVLPSRPDLDAVDFLVLDDPQRRATIAASSDMAAVQLTETEIDDLIAFLEALTDPASLDLKDDVPRGVPSGLPIDD